MTHASAGGIGLADDSVRAVAIWRVAACVESDVEAVFWARDQAVLAPILARAHAVDVDGPVSKLKCGARVVHRRLKSKA